MSLASGTRLGSYEIVALLGAGGMGEVYRARDFKLKREVAIKVLPESLARDPGALGRFEREAYAVAALSHPNILSIFDFGSEGDVTYAVTEILEGGTLRERLDAGPISPRQAVEYALQIARGLAAAHEKGIVHRDLKPENVFVTNADHVKILDFGLAKKIVSVAPGKETSAPTVSGHTEPGAVMGTVRYMSPEQVRGFPVDHRTDIFSFGAILYELLSGQKAFQRTTNADTMAAIMRDEPPELAPPRGTISPTLDHIVKHCLEKDREKRFQSARDIAFALTEQSLPPIVTGVSPQVAVLAASKRWPVLVAAGLLVLFATAAAILLARRPRPASPTTGPSIAVLPFRNLTGDPSQEYFSDGLSEELAGVLAKVKDLRVAGHMSSSVFKGKPDDLASIGQQLRVATVLEGSVRRSGGQLRISAQLVNVKDGYQIWAETYNRRLTDVLSVQDEIAASVVTALKVKLLPQERLALSQNRTSNTEAYNQFLLGRQFYNLQNQDGFRRAVAAYEKAIALDPGYAIAYAWLARSQTLALNYTKTGAEHAEGRRKALWAAERAVQLDPGLAEGYAARANVRTVIGRDWDRAQEDFDRALALDPGNPLTHNQYGRLLAKLGRLPEAIAECRKATELDPLFPGALNLLGQYLYFDGQLPEARKVLARTLEISPENDFGRFFFGVTLLLQGNPKEALSGLGPPTTALRRTLLALAEHSLGHEKESQDALEELIAKHPQNAYRVAEVYAWRGENDRAFEWLERAFGQNDLQVSYVNTDPLFANLRGDARYAAILERLNLPAGN